MCKKALTFVAMQGVKEKKNYAAHYILTYLYPYFIFKGDQ